MKEFFSELLEEHVAKLGKKIDNVTSCSRNDLRARFLEAGAWSRHYSTIRSATTTFLFGIALGILNVKWSQPQPIFVWSALAVWVSGFTLFIVYTRDEYKMFDRQEKHRHLMRSAAEQCKVGEVKSRWKRDKAVFVVVLLTILFLITWEYWANDVLPFTLVWR